MLAPARRNGRDGMRHRRAALLRGSVALLAMGGVPAVAETMPGPAAPAVPQAVPMTMDVCPNTYEGVPGTAPTIVCTCPAEAVREGGGASLYGANPYFYQSSVCRAAMQAGAITAQGGRVTIAPATAPFFPGVTRNGVTSAGWPSAGRGFRVVLAAGEPDRLSRPAAPKAMVMDVCPNDYAGFPEDAPALTCTCPPEAARKGGTVYGANPYYYQSSVCRAAVNAGAITTQGGRITITPEAAPFFPAVTRNGVRGNGWGSGRGFRVAVSGAPPVPAYDGAPGQRRMTLDVCPTSYEGFPEDAPALVCSCPPDLIKQGGDLYGSNPYYWQSAVCRAAVHAGVIGAKTGGQVLVTPEAADFFPGTSRNGQRSMAWGSRERGFRVAPAPGARPVVGAIPASEPVQAPIAASLHDAGRVQVYVHFVTDSDRLQPSSGPVLHELLDALHNDPAMRVELIGHTDSQGSAPHNQDLSERRAASVYLWLVQHGIDRDRLRSSGKGMREPIADNDTVAGRALNRRVEVRVIR